MKKTILITGSSSGIGRETVRYFSQNGWQVAATMRTPEKDTEMSTWPGVRLYKLDVTDQESVSIAIENAISDFGSVDVICNNAGYGAIGIFEKSTDEQVRRQFETNVFGCMNVIRGVLPHFRGKRAGTIINVTSMGGLITFPIYSLYHGTKWAMEGFSESLAYELKPLGIKVKLIEPGAIKTDFYDRSQELFANQTISGYDDYEKIAFENTQSAGATAPGPKIVAQVIFKAASDNSMKLRYPVGIQSKILLCLRRLIPQTFFFFLVRKTVEKGL